MKIGFLALSGLRAYDPRLMELGMSLPAVVQRSRIVSAMPSLGLLYLAAVTPKGHELRYFEGVDELQLPPEVFSCDLVALSSLSAQARVAYRVAARLREHGIRVVMGGLHASVEPSEASNHVDAVVVGEGENVWPEMVRAAESGNLAGVWRASEFEPLDIHRLPVPRYDLLDACRYQRFPVQTSRGCPWRCDFCASGVMLRQKYRRRKVSDIVRDIQSLIQLQSRPFIEFADDNTFVDKEWGKELCRAITPLGIKWFTETDISVADDSELLSLMRRAGCRQVLIGLESPDLESLNGIELKANFKARRWETCRDAVRRIQQHGITVNGCFILGLDGHDENIFEQVFEMANEIPLFEVQITVLTPFPGTPLYDRLLQEDRLIDPQNWDLCTLFDVNFEPKGMSAEQLRNGLYWLAERLYDPACVARRQQGFFAALRT